MSGGDGFFSPARRMEAADEYFAALARAAAAAFDPGELARMRAAAEAHDRRARERRERLRHGGDLVAVSVRGRDVIVADLGTGEVLHAAVGGDAVAAVYVRCVDASGPLRATLEAADGSRARLTRHACRSVDDVVGFLSGVLAEPRPFALRGLPFVVLPGDPHES